MINWSAKCVKNKEEVESPLSITEKFLRAAVPVTYM